MVEIIYIVNMMNIAETSTIVIEYFTCFESSRSYDILK